eukprot:TRINITY_DN6535_c0_g1_i1.p1 TRINITY_DN6535_c0_g1~~TRINITY_DN6535_c0_g1_i1.p1  ORF type:complete len:430 (-),score=129.79 TRINITY_DN6535_c0_g1_i1:26-1315(-)
MANKLVISLAVVLALVAFISAQSIPDQDWGYVTVRPKAHMFWWLYGTANKAQRPQTPLVMWLQGGPGASGTGFGNFEEIGPVDVNQNPRPYSWVKAANLLFVDNPVGTGYSYVEDDSAYTTNEKQIASDLLALLSGFLKKYPAFRSTPFYIFSESYGGKMAASFAKALYDAIQAGTIQCTFGGVAMGDSWIDPMSFVNAWGPYLYTMGEVDGNGLAQINAAAAATQKLVDQQQWAAATNQWGNTEQILEDVSMNVNFYNILDRTGDNMKKRGLRPFSEMFLARFQEDPLTQLMNGPLKQKLGIPDNVTWAMESDTVFNYLSVDFMQSVIPTVDYLLKNNVNVVVISGNLDLICCTIGTLNWMSKLTWSGYQSWYNTNNQPITVNNLVAGYIKSYQNLSFYTIFGAGHMVPYDQPQTALTMLQTVINNNK